MEFNSSTPSKPGYNVCHKMFSWTAVFIGALVAVGLSFLLDLFAKGIGLSLYTTNTTGALVLVVGGFVALIIGSIAIMFTAGFAAGFFAAPKCREKNFGLAHGFVAWCLGLVLMGWLLSPMMHMHKNMYSTTTTQEFAKTSENVASKIHPATDTRDTSGEKAVRTTGLATLAIFIIFFIGALSASFGGYFGFRCWEKCESERRF